MSGHELPLAEWETFFLIVGSSAGVLTGLMFVVIALGQGRRTPVESRALQAFVSPTMVHFIVVLTVAAVLVMPDHTRATMAVFLLAVAAALLVYMMLIFVRARRQESYAPDRSDWIWHFCVPAVAYASVLTAGALSWSSPKASLYVLASSMLVLLYVGIRNAWDSAVWVVFKAPDA